MISQTLNKIVNDLQRDFSLNPYDYTSSEIEAQIRIFNKLNEVIKGKVVINNNGPIPPFINLESYRVKLEYVVNKNKHDIVIFKDNSKCESYDDVEAFIEVKVGWGFTKDHLLHNTAIKDFELLSKFPEEGFLIFFLANNFDDLKGKQQIFYKETLEKHKIKYKINNNHIYLIFRDKIIS